MTKKIKDLLLVGVERDVKRLCRENVEAKKRLKRLEIQVDKVMLKMKELEKFRNERR